MYLKVEKSETAGTVSIPGSKSHTIRGIFIASLAGGRSVILNPLFSEDAMSAVRLCRAFGAGIEVYEDRFEVEGFNGMPLLPDNVIDVGNSGTTLRFGLMTAGLVEGCTVFTGDDQIRRRPLGALIRAMNELGAKVFSTRDNDMAPVVVRGRMTGGRAELDAVTSQYLSSILINGPLLDRDTEIVLTRLNEIPYVDMTMWWLDNQDIEYKNDDYKNICIKGRQGYKAFNISIPGDFSSATFFMVLAAISGREIRQKAGEATRKGIGAAQSVEGFTLKNLDMTDPQGDKKVLDYLMEMGAEIKYGPEGIIVKGGELKGIEIDMNDTPDALPAMAVAGCFARGETRLCNVPQARLKETDRIHTMCVELKKMGADIEELADGLVVRESRLTGCRVNGHYDHRVVMALAVAGLNAEGVTVIDTAEAVNITFPEFCDIIKSCGGKAEMLETL